MSKQHQITVFAKPNGAWARAAKSKSTKTSPSPTSPSDPIIQKSKNLTSTFTEIRLISAAGTFFKIVYSNFNIFNRRTFI